MTSCLFIIGSYRPGKGNMHRAYVQNDSLEGRTGVGVKTDMRGCQLCSCTFPVDCELL